MSSAVESNWALTRQEAQWLLGSTPVHLEVLEKRAGVPQRRRGYTLQEFERMSKASRLSVRRDFVAV
jgi:hypothetical protein